MWQEPPNPSPGEADVRSGTSGEPQPWEGALGAGAGAARGQAGANGAPLKVRNKSSGWFGAAPLPHRSPLEEQTPAPFSHARFSWVCASFYCLSLVERALEAGGGRTRRRLWSSFRGRQSWSWGSSSRTEEKPFPVLCPGGFSIGSVPNLTARRSPVEPSQPPSPVPAAGRRSGG